MRRFKVIQGSQAEAVFKTDALKSCLRGSYRLRFFDIKLRALKLYAVMQLPTWTKQGKRVTLADRAGRVRVHATVTSKLVIAIVVDVFDGAGWVSPLDHVNP